MIKEKSRKLNHNLIIKKIKNDGYFIFENFFLIFLIAIFSLYLKMKLGIVFLKIFVYFHTILTHFHRFSNIFGMFSYIFSESTQKLASRHPVPLMNGICRGSSPIPPFPPNVRFLGASLENHDFRSSAALWSARDGLVGSGGGSAVTFVGH